MAVRKRGDGFQADFMIKGTRHRGQFAALAAAETWEAEVRLAYLKGTPVPPAGAPSGPAGRRHYRTLGEVFDYVKAHEWAGTKAEVDLVRNGRYVVEHFGRNEPVANLGKADIDTFILSLKTRRNSGGTINRKLAALSKLFTVAVQLGAMASRPSIRRQREAEGRERFLTEAEADALVATLRQWSKDAEAALTAFLVDTGLRVGEALSLSWADVRGTYVTVIGEKSKSGRTRHVPLTERAAAVLADRRQTEGIGPFRGVTYQAFRHQFERVVGHFRLEDVVIHTLRHTTASWLVMRGVDLYRVMKFMGHASMKTTQRYAKLAPNSLDGLADVLGQRATPPALREAA